ncbi:DUF4376 domain-containing protein [Variovorax paradoxus]|uniref:DUF4376 domain-containing protein n=1 Tax=Variovorax paradoxus TaxID=34073 RepID=UPI001ABC7981
MSVTFIKNQPNGALSLIHEILRIEISDGAAVAWINSYATEAAWRATPKLINWQDSFLMPIAEVGNAETWLIGTDGPFSGGAILAEPSTLEEKRKTLVARASAKRWAVETGGLTLPDGTHLLTARTDQDRITSILVTAASAEIETIDFKAQSGWVRLDVETLRQMAVQIARHVQACFSAERVHHRAIAALETDAQFDAYDCATGWPSIDLRAPSVIPNSPSA